MTKKRTQARFENAIISGMRTAFARYSPKYLEVLMAARIEKDNINKDGSVSKVKSVWYKCNVCGELSKAGSVDIDHIVPVVEIGKSRHDYNLQEFKDRLDCDISNLQVICEECHNKKTEEEKVFKKQKNKKGE